MTPAVISVNPGDGLQAVHDSLPASGGTIAIGDATYYANPLNPSTPLVITKPIEIFGMGGSISGIGSPILNASSSVGFSKLFMRPPGAAYAMRIYNGGTFTPRCWFNHVFVGASFNGAGDGPVDGIQLDAAGVLLAEQLTVAFCTGQGLLVDSTGAEGNTTLKFDMCSFVQNALYGVKITTSCTVAEFNGGNMESNGSIVLGVPVGGEFYAENCGVVAILGVDFERDPTDVAINNIVEFENVNSVRIIGNNFLKGSAVHGFLMAGCASGRYEENRFEGWGAAGVCRVAETSQNISQGVNHLVNVGSWIENYSR
jgi:hypothetical protein